MNQKIYHGEITPSDVSHALLANFNRGNYRVQQVGDNDTISVQIATINQPLSGGQTALTIRLQKIPDGVSITIGQQAWFGVAASLGATALAALRNPFSLLGRLDDLAQDIESLQLNERVIAVIDNLARSKGVDFEFSERLRRMTCSYCSTANPVGQPRCLACGAPLGEEQPFTCIHCGFILEKTELFCPNCNKPVILNPQIGTED